jgi:cobalt-zinc-cadmium efflux system outer membrane protein
MKCFIPITAAAVLLVAPHAVAQNAPSHQEMPGMQMDQPTRSPAPTAPNANNDSNQPKNPPAIVPGTTENPNRPLPTPDLLKDVVGRPPIALAEFLDFADHANPTLNQAQALVRRSEQQARQAGLYPNPSIGYQGEQIRGGVYGGGEQGGFVQQTIVLGGKLGLRRDIYQQQSRADQTGVEEQTYRVHSDVTQAFYTALAAQTAVVVRQRLLSVAADAVETVHQLANVGQADSPDILQTEVEAEQAKVDFVVAQRRFLQSFRALAALAGKPELPVSPLSGSLETLPELNAEQQVQKVVEASPAIKRAEEEIAVQQAKLRDAKREIVPDLDLRAGEQYNGERVAELPGVKTAGAQSFATAGISIPLWNRNQGNIGAATSDLERAQEDLIRTRLAIKQHAETLAASYLSARYTADHYRTELMPRAQRAYQLYWTKYQSMAQAYPQVLVSQRTLFQLQIGYLMALLDAWTNAIALQNYALSGGLTAPESSSSSIPSSSLSSSGTNRTSQ